MRNRSAVSRFAVLLLLATAACSSSTGPDLNSITARARWASRAPAAYSITIQRSCECLPETVGPVTVVVRNGVVTSRTYVYSGAAVDSRYAAVFPTVDGLFALLDEWERNGSEPIKAQFHALFGYPVRISLGDPATDGPVYTVTEFRVQ